MHESTRESTQQANNKMEVRESLITSVNENCTLKSKPQRHQTHEYCVIYSDSSAKVLLDFNAVQIAHDQLKE